MEILGTLGISSWDVGKFWEISGWNFGEFFEFWESGVPWGDPASDFGWIWLNLKRILTKKIHYFGREFGEFGVPWVKSKPRRKKK